MKVEVGLSEEGEGPAVGIEEKGGSLDEEREREEEGEVGEEGKRVWRKMRKVE